PIFASGYATLARVYLREHQFSIEQRAGDAPPLDRALRAAERAIELKPNSARANFALMDINVARGDFNTAKAAGERSIELNPYDVPGVFHYGSQLIMSGEIDRGLEVIQQIPADAAAPPPRPEVLRFLRPHPKGDTTV